MLLLFFIFFFFNDTATTEIYTLSLHDALPISYDARAGHADRSSERGARHAGGACAGGCARLCLGGHPWDGYRRGWRGACGCSRDDDQGDLGVYPEGASGGRVGGCGSCHGAGLARGVEETNRLEKGQR